MSSKDSPTQKGVEIAQLIVESCDQESLPAHIGIVSGQEMCVGRNSDNDVCLDNAIVSKQHFRIYSVLFYNDADNERFENVYCKDLESRNGTYVNNTIIGSIAAPQYGFLLTDGDIISVKPYWTFRFHQPQNQSQQCVSKTQEKEQEQFKEEFFISDRLLGTGATASVHLARHVPTGLQLACKIVSLQRADPCRIVAEINILSKLDHPNIVRLRKAFVSHNRIYIFQELAAGGDLFSYVESKRYLVSNLDARIITRQITRAVHFLHTKNIVHRDLKVENILITHNMDMGHRILITDFGQAFDRASTTRRMKSFVGTRDYIAPEIFAENLKNGYTQAVDMWSIGIIVLLLTTGEMFFQNGTSQTPADYVLQKISIAMADGSSPSSKWWFEILHEGRDFIIKLLVHNGSERMTAGEAKDHPWVAPKHLIDDLVALDRRAQGYWTPSLPHIDVMEQLKGDLSPKVDPIDIMAHQLPRRSRKSSCQTDPTDAVCFNLDRYIAPRKTSHRREMLKKAQKSETKFITPTELKWERQAVETQESDIESVDGNDLFKNTPVEVAAAREAALDLEAVMGSQPLNHQDTAPGDSTFHSSNNVEYERQIIALKRRRPTWEEDLDQHDGQQSRYFARTI